MAATTAAAETAILALLLCQVLGTCAVDDLPLLHFTVGYTVTSAIRDAVPTIAPAIVAAAKTAAKDGLSDLIAQGGQGQPVAPLIVALARDGRNPRLADEGSNQINNERSNWLALSSLGYEVRK